MLLTSECYHKICIFRLYTDHLILHVCIKDTALEKHRKTLKKFVEFFIVNSIGLLSSLPSNRTCWTVFIMIF